MITASLMLALGLCNDGCRTALPSANRTEINVTDDANAIDEELSQCVAVRGNGTWISTHFSSLARIVGDYGEIDGLAGGSSATVTTMIYESILLNPVVSSCKESDGCGRIDEDPQTVREQRIVLLLKSIYGYLGELKHRIDTVPNVRGSAITEIPQFWQALKKLSQADLPKFIENAKQLEKTYGLRDMLSHDFLNFLLNINAPPDFRIAEAQKVLDNFGKFSVEDPTVFFRPGLINFKSLAKIIARFADFYAGRYLSQESERAFSEWIDQCATVTEPHSWSAMAGAKHTKLSHCARDFYPILDAYLGSYEDNVNAQPSVKSRLYDPVGRGVPSLIGTSVLTNAATKTRFEKRRKDDYWNGKSVEDFVFDFQDVGFGYWGPSVSFNAQVKLNIDEAYPDDLKSQKFVNLGGADWQTVLELSLAEPGQAPMQTIMRKDGNKLVDTGLMSIGGWSDLHPVQVLKAGMKCKKVIYLTREGGEADIVMDASKHLGASDQSQANLYYTSGKSSERFAVKPDTARSSFEQALKDADGVWCTKWNDFSGSEILAMAEQSYSADFYTKHLSYTVTKAKNIYNPDSLPGGMPGCIYHERPHVIPRNEFRP